VVDGVRKEKERLTATCHSKASKTLDSSPLISSQPPL
jgi:hypothetical protein